MKLHFSRQGRQFFFFTFCIEGRQPLLSHLEPGPAPRPIRNIGGRGGLAPRPLEEPAHLAPGGGRGGIAPRPLEEPARLTPDGGRGGL
ncbi:MAG: hypothetical protein IKR81_11935, partial [Victivallales bacterium]|nr:hypothetical protein [Victivallales bacterium]